MLVFVDRTIRCAMQHTRFGALCNSHGGFCAQRGRCPIYPGAFFGRRPDSKTLLTYNCTHAHTHIHTHTHTYTHTHTHTHTLTHTRTHAHAHTQTRLNGSGRFCCPLRGRGPTSPGDFYPRSQRLKSSPQAALASLACPS